MADHQTGAAHTNPIISQVVLPGSNTIYDIHDAHAIHDVEDLRKLQGIFNFKGVVANTTALKALTNMVSGDVYLVTDTKTEYVYYKADGATTGTWYEFGGMHTHTHTATVSGTCNASAVNVNVSGKTYTADTTKLSATQAAPTLGKSLVLGDGTTVSITGNGLGTVSKDTLGVNVTAPTASFVNSITVGTAANAIATLKTSTIQGLNSFTNVTIPQYTFADVTASKVTLGDDIVIPNVESVNAVTASKATSATSKTASYVTTVDTSVGSASAGTKFTIPNVSNVTSVTASNITSNTDVVASKATSTTALATSKVTKGGAVTATKDTFSVTNGVLTIGSSNVNALSDITVTAVNVPQWTFSDVTATKTAFSAVSPSKVTLGTAFSVPNISVSTVNFKAVNTATNVTATQWTFSDVAASKVTMGTDFSVPNVTGATDVTGSKATAGTALTASYVTSTGEKTYVTGASTYVAAVPSVTFTSANAVNGVSASLTGTTNVVTDVASTGLTATINPENINAVTSVTEGAITIKSGTTGDVTVATGITGTNATFAGSGTAAGQAWNGTVTVQSWSDSNQEV